jgi:hypothetical protein
MLTAEELRERLDYDPLTGVFTWRASNNFSYKTGDVAGYYTDLGYRRIEMKGRSYAAHRLAWLHVYGVWPPAELDHINGVRDDNRIANLREATRAENNRNTKAWRNKRCALKGVDMPRGRGFRARIRAQGKSVHLGYYGTEEEAHAAYKAAAEKEFGAFARAE